ncbi:MAG: isochorismatase family protein [Nanoarchaeota archaeon]
MFGYAAVDERNSSLNCIAHSPSLPRVTGNLAILIIDMQNQFLSEVEDEEKRFLFENQLGIIREARRNGTPRIVVNSRYSEDKELKKLIGSKKTIYKDDDSAFSTSTLDDYLRSEQITDLYLMGLFASESILLTSRNALKKGYKVHTSFGVIANPRNLDYLRKSSFSYKTEGINLS